MIRGTVTKRTKWEYLWSSFHSCRGSTRPQAIKTIKNAWSFNEATEKKSLLTQGQTRSGPNVNRCKKTDGSCLSGIGALFRVRSISLRFLGGQPPSPTPRLFRRWVSSRFRDDELFFGNWNINGHGCLVFFCQIHIRGRRRRCG